MAFLINIVTVIGTGIWWIIQKFFPFLVKKFGLSTVKMAIQKAISAVLILVTIAFYGSVIVFISETYTRFRFLLDVISNPSSAGFGDSQYLSCFYYLLQVSGISAGFNSAFAFGISVFVFFFLRGLYALTIKTLKLISDEVSKSLKLI